MREFVVVSGNSIVHRVAFEDSEYGLYLRAVSGDVEAHNALHPGATWAWGEAGTSTDPTLTDAEREALSGQAEVDRIASLSAEHQAIELEARLDALAGEADTRKRKADIRGQSFDPAAWFQEESAKISALYTKV